MIIATNIEALLALIFATIVAVMIAMFAGIIVLEWSSGSANRDATIQTHTTSTR